VQAVVAEWLKPLNVNSSSTGAYVNPDWKDLVMQILKEIGIRKGHTVLDFGCGSGNYTIPAAKIVGNTGKVYALDKDKWDLDKLMQRARSAGLRNIEKVKTSGGLKIPLEDGSVDVVLFYDVLHHYYFSPHERKELLKEAYRVSKPDAIVSVNPKHIEPAEIEKEMADANFYLEKRYAQTLLVHDDNLEESQILNFRKINKDGGDK
jgi:ubiquinone/menaquinone biosynthesis C-methylase UbiE